jgi:manganese transport protein
LSQVVLSFGLPFAVIPLIFYTANREIMGVLVNHKITTIAGSLIAILIVTLNIFLIYQLLFIGS